MPDPTTETTVRLTEALQITKKPEEVRNKEDKDEPDGHAARRVAELIKKHKDKPFFIAAGFHKPHLPWIAPKKYFDLYPPEKIDVGDDSSDAAIELGVTHRGARVRGRVAQSSGLPLDPEARAVLIGRSPLAFPRKAVGEIDRSGQFVIPGVLPGRSNGVS